MAQLILLSPVLAAVAYFDLRYMRIPNQLVYYALALFLVSAPLVGWPEIGARAAAALVVLAVGFVFFALGLFGGGDAKMMAALMLFVPTNSYLQFAYLFSAAMIIGIGIVVVLRCVPLLSASSWESLKRKGTFPMGISIAMTGMLHPILNNGVI